MEPLITPRLTLRQFGVEDLDALAPLQEETSFWQYPMGRGMTRAGTSAFLDRTICRYAEDGVAMCAVVVSETRELAGWAGLAVPHFLPQVLPSIEVGWRLGEAFRGRGYATEAGAAWVRWGFEEFGLERVISIYEPANIASGRVMDKLGFELELETVDTLRGRDLRVTALTRARWSERGARKRPSA